MNWKSITTHAALMLCVGVVAGFFEPRPDLGDTNAVLTAYLATEMALFVAWVGIVTHLAFKAPNWPFLHALLAALLSEITALVLISLMPFEPYTAPLPLVVFEHAVSLAAVVTGTLVGTRMRRHKQSGRAVVDAPPANGG